VGQAPVRAVRDMAALAGTRRHRILRAISRHLVEARKPKKVTLIACMRQAPHDPERDDADTHDVARSRRSAWTPTSSGRTSSSGGPMS